MAIPDKPLNFKGGNLTFDELDALLSFMNEGQQRVTRESLRGFRKMLVSCSDWTDEEVGKLAISDLLTVFKMIEGSEQDAAVNPTNASG